MAYYDEDDEEEREPEELPEVRLDEEANCSICGKEGCTRGCFRCGQPVHYNAQNYFDGSPCGGWILDTWHPGHPQENEFYCNMCLHAGLLQENEPLQVNDFTFAYSDHKTVTVTIDGQARELSRDETRDLVAFLYDQRRELFFNDETEQPQPAAVGSDQADDLGDLDKEPF